MKSLRIAAISFPVLLAAFWFTGVYFGITERLGSHPASVVVSFTLLLAPYWFFGFGLAGPLKAALTRPIQRVAAAALFLLPYLTFSISRGEFRPGLCAGMLAAILGLIALLEFVTSVWADYCALLAVALIIESYAFSSAFPIPGLTGLAKLLFVDVMLYGYLVVRPNMEVGFDLRARLNDFAVGLREFMYYTPVALLLGFALSFLHFHKNPVNPAWFAAGWLFTLFFVALPEEIFFRGFLLNLLEKKMSTRTALLVTSVIFGLAHYPKGAVFNWRYVVLAAVAGVFYGRSYLANRRLLSAGITHATVDTIWSIWFK